MVYGSVKYKLDPFYGLVLASAVIGLIFFGEKEQVFTVIGQGFGKMLSNIAFIIVFGALLGELLYRARTFEAISAAVFRGPLGAHPDLALGCIGLVVGIPVFCDSGYLVLRNLKEALGGSVNQKMRNTIMLASGLYLSHTLVPPTPGPLIIIETLGETDHLADFILVGSLISVLVLLALLIVSRLRFKNDTPEFEEEGDLKANHDMQDLPDIYRGLIPLILPLVLIALGSLSKVFGFSSPWLRTVAHPAMALFLACLVALAFNRGLFSELTQISSVTLSKVAPILLLTGAGGAFGAVMAETGFIEQFNIQGGKGIVVLVLVAFGLAALIKSLQGSSTGAIVVTSSLLAPVLATYQFGLSENFALFAAIGGGSMLVSHTNDSYFWVIAKFENYSIKQAIKGWTLSTGILALLTLISALLIANATI